MEGKEKEAREAARQPKGRFPGLSHEEVLFEAARIPKDRGLIDGLIDEGAVGTFVGPPEAYKSWLALGCLMRVAGLGGEILGRRVLRTGPTGAWLQDDPRSWLLKRIEMYSTAHRASSLPVRWHLNEQLMLPPDISNLRVEIEREAQRFVLLDSLYNFMPVSAMRDEYAAETVVRLKDVADQTGCSIAFVDHTPWSDEGRRTPSRGYGSVFKAAVVRFTIHIDKVGERRWIDAHGNNIAGLKRTPAVFNEETLEFELLGSEEDAEPPKPPLRERVQEFKNANPAATRNAVVKGVSGRRQEILKILDELDREAKEGGG